MIKYPLLAFSLMLAVFTISPVSADESSSLALKYTILSEGKNIGELTQRLFQDENGHSFAEHSHIKVSGWWRGIDITSSLIESFNGVNGFSSVDSKTLDGTTAYWTKIERNKKGLRGLFSEIKKTTVWENKALANMGIAITSTLVSNFGEIQSLSGAVFTNRSDQSQGTQFIRNDFDTTEINLPFFINSFGSKPLPDKLRLLDTENLKINSVKLTDLGNEEITISEKTFQSRHLTLAGSRFKPSHIWINNEDISLPYLIRFVGEDEDGPVEIRLNSPPFFE